MELIEDTVTASYPAFMHKLKSKECKITFVPLEEGRRRKIIYDIVKNEDKEYQKLVVTIDEHKPIVLIDNVKIGTTENNRLKVIIQQLSTLLLKLDQVERVEFKLNKISDVNLAKLNKRLVNMWSMVQGDILQSFQTELTLSPIYITSIKDKILKLLAKSDNSLV